MNLIAISRVLADEDVECPACGVRGNLKASRCASCGDEMHDAHEPSLSFLQTGGMSMTDCASATRHVGPNYVTLQNSESYLYLKVAVLGAQEGSLTLDQYAWVVSKLYNMADTRLRALASEPAECKFARESVETRAARDEMREGLRLIHTGTSRMMAYLETHNLVDVTEGASTAEAGFVKVERARDRAAGIMAQETHTP